MKTSLCIALLLTCLLNSRPAAAQEAEAGASGQTPIALGDTAPAFTLTASGGESHSLEELKGRKNLVLVFFRGTW